MKLNVIISRIEDNEVVFDFWFTSVADAWDTFDLLKQGLCVGYSLHIVLERSNGSADLLKEYVKEGC